MEQRLIDANALKAIIRPPDSDDYRNAVLLSDVRKILHNFVDNAPTIDAVEVVRCGECKHRETCMKQLVFWERDHVLEMNTYQYHDLSFCSYGDRGGK